MSFAEASESLRPILLRSSTPGLYAFFLNMYRRVLHILFRNSTSVLLYLEGLRESQTYGSPISTGLPPLTSPFGKRSALTNEEEIEDIQSNIQDGRKTELSTDQRSEAHEPGPQDPPGPRYESFDSGPSFGNFGPLPDNISHNGEPPWGKSWEVRYPAEPACYLCHLVPLPISVASPVTAPITITIEHPSTTTGSKSHSRRAPSQTSGAPSKPQKSVVSAVESESRKTVTGRAQQMIPSKASSARGAVPEDPPMSPARRSRAGSKSRAGTEYPPLPPSTFLSPSGRTAQLPTSPRSHRREPSISPSDSPSQAPLKEARRAIAEKERAQSVASAVPDPDGAVSRRGPLSAAGSPISPSHQSRPFSPYRCAPTNEDLFAGAAQVQAISQVASQMNGGGSKLSHVSHQTHKTHQTHHSHHSRSQRSHVEEEVGATPTPSRPHSPTFSLDAEEECIVAATLAARGAGNRTSYAPSTLEPEIVNSHFHDIDLCILLHQMDDPSTHEVVKKALRKAVRQRVKKLGMKYDAESIKEYRKSFHDHDPTVHLDADYQPPDAQEPPEWAKELINGMIRVQERLDVLSPQSVNPSIPPRSMQSYPESSDSRQQRGEGTEYTEGGDQYGQTPRTQTVNINTQVTGTMAESMYRNGTELIDDEYADTEEVTQRFAPATVTETRGVSEFMTGDRDDSPGQQFLEEELYKLRVKPGGSQSGLSHKTWEVARDDDQEEYEEGQGAFTESGLPEIPDGGNYTDHRPSSPPLPPIPQESSRGGNSQVWNPAGDGFHDLTPPPWQRIHQRLLNWAIIWPISELDAALSSTTRGHQVDEVALSIWSTQTYKRYVRSRMTDVPGGKVDRLFVPPNMADAISTAVFNGRHGEASAILKDLWTPFGFESAPRLVVVLAKHRSDVNHWVVHRFSLPDGALTTYDSYPERTLPDGRPLGWWFAIRLAWPGAIYANPDHLMQKMVRLHRPMQLNIDNSVAAAGIWRNVLMGSRAERSLDLERLRDLVNTEVKNLRQRKLQGKLSISSPRPQYDDM
ncbi:hypothetical protein ID866_4874 [Astraeus odoratus]|nr:hypothetical protein ID866_4874 [Astraeus odoratus]